MRSTGLLPRAVERLWAASSRVIGRKTSGAGDAEELTLSDLLDFVGSAAQGDILYRGASSWARLAAGTSGDFLKTNGAGADPSWATVSGGAGKWFRTFSPGDNEAPTSNYATPDSRNNRPVLEFDTTTQETAIFSDVLGFNYAGGGLTVTIYAAMDTATTGTLGWDVAMERTQASTDDTDSDSFASAVTITAATVPGTSGQILAMSATLSNGSNMDSTAAGEMFRLRIRRDVANDTAAGDAQVFAVHVREN